MTIPYKTILQSAFLTVLTLFGRLLAGGVGFSGRQPGDGNLGLGRRRAGRRGTLHDADRDVRRESGRGAGLFGYI